MNEYIKLKIASPNNILAWTERLTPNGNLIGEVKNNLRQKNT